MVDNEDKARERAIATLRRQLRRQREKLGDKGDPFNALLSAVDRLDEVALHLRDPFVGGLLEETTEFLRNERGEING